MVMLMYIWTVFNETNDLVELPLLIIDVTYHLVRNYNERFGKHANTQTIDTFLGTSIYVYDVFAYVPGTYHSYSTQIQRHQRQYHTRT